MKKYLVKKTYTALRSNHIYNEGHTETYYVGKKGNSYTELCEYMIEYGWSKKHFAEKCIQDDIDFETRMKQNFWKIEYEIIETQG